MNQEELLTLHSELCDKGRKIMQLKNADYGATGDPFANFRMSALLHIQPEMGALLRMQDKMARIVSFIEKGELKVKDESVEDSIIDLINYAVIVRGILKEKVWIK